jgi:UDP-glucose 4-epimerase
MVVPRFIKSALLNEDLTVFGDGKQTRCFAHVYDVIEAVIKVAFSEKTIGRVVNVGNNTEISISDLAKKVIKETNSQSKIEFVPYIEAYGQGFEDMERRVPNLDLIQELVGWEPLRELTEMIEDISREMKITL